MPLCVAQKLLQRLRHHRAAPDHRRLDVDEKADRHGLQAVGLHRLQRLAVARLGLVGDAQHLRLRRPVDVRIQQTHVGALGRQRQRQVHRGGGLAHSALAGGHGDDVLHLRHQLDAALHAVRDDLAIHVGGNIARARDRLQLVDDALANTIDLALGRIAQFNVDCYVGTIDLDIPCRTRTEEILPCVRINDFLEDGLHLQFGNAHCVLH